MSSSTYMSKILVILGWIAVIMFGLIYGIEVFPSSGPPVTILWIHKIFGKTGLIILNILMVLAFLALLPYRRPTKHIWKSRGTFIAFTIALMTEMFGWPLLIFIISPLIDVPVLAHKYFQVIGRWPTTVGTAISIGGIILIVFGWVKIHKAHGLVTSGIYRYMRHPQYTGIFLFTFGWIVHYPSFITLLFWPILMLAYMWLARQEERQAIEEFGEHYLLYAKQTKRFIPFVF